MNMGTRPGTRTILLVITLAVLATASALQAADDFAGKWRSEISSMGGQIVVLLNLEQDVTGRWKGFLKSSEAPDEVLDLERVKVEGRGISFSISYEDPRIEGTIRNEFDLRYRPSEGKLKGTVTASMAGFEREAPVEFKRVVEKTSAEGISFLSDRPVVGTWAVRPDKDDKEREFQLGILPHADDYKGTITDTGADATVAMRDLDVKDSNVVSFNFRFADAPFVSSFWGRYDEVRDEIRGTMSVGGRSQRLEFKRTSEGPDDVEDEFGTEKKKPLPIKHDHRFAVTVRGALWQPLYVLKEKHRNINDITTGSYAGDAGVRWYVLDYFALQVRYARGGIGFDTNENNLSLFDQPEIRPRLTADSYLSLDGFEFSTVGYLGQSIIPDSKFNPFITALAGRTTWELTESGRGSDIVAIFEKPLEGTCWTFGIGLGTEYALSTRFGLEFEWMWAYNLTEDETVWHDVDTQWTNQHVYRLSLGGIFWF